MDIETRASRVRLLVLDVDGVLTPGQLLFGAEGEVLKVFHTQDGLGIAAARRAGLNTAVITGRHSEMVRRRCEELGFTAVRQAAADKVRCLEEILTDLGLAPEDAAYVGDDLNDLAVMARVGFAVAVANAVPEVRAAAHMVTGRRGGEGAVREVVEFIIKVQGKWEDIVAGYRAGAPAENRQ